MYILICIKWLKYIIAYINQYIKSKLVKIKLMMKKYTFATLSLHQSSFDNGCAPFQESGFCFPLLVSSTA